MNKSTKDESTRTKHFFLCLSDVLQRNPQWHWIAVDPDKAVVSFHLQGLKLEMWPLRTSWQREGWPNISVVKQHTVFMFTYTFLCMTTPKKKNAVANAVLLSPLFCIEHISIHFSKWVMVRNVLQMAPSISCVSPLHNSMYQLTQINIAMATTTRIFLSIVDR